MSKNTTLKKLHNKISKMFPQMSFNVDGYSVSTEFQNGFFIFRDVSDSFSKSIAVQFAIPYESITDEVETIKCLNKINSNFNLVATLVKFSENHGHISFAPILIPPFSDKEDIDTAIENFTCLKIFLTMIEDEGYFETLKTLIKCEV